MDFITRGAGHWKHVAKSKAWLHFSDVLKIHTRTGAAKHAVLPHFLLVQPKFTADFEHGRNSCDARDSPIFVGNRVGENQTVFELLRAVILAAAYQRVVTEHGLKGETLAEFHIVKNERLHLRVFADLRISGNAHTRSD